MDEREREAFERGPSRRVERERRRAEREPRNVFSRAARYSTIAPIFPNDFDEENAFTGLAEMAGFGGREKGIGHDALEGIDAMVMGRVHAPGELAVDSATSGGPLELDPFETLFSDDAGFGDLDPTLPLDSTEDPGVFDWVSHYRIAPEEMV